MSTRRMLMQSFVLALSAYWIAPCEAAPGARLKADFSKLTARASEAFNVTVDRNTIEWASQAIGAQGGDVAALREVMKELEGVYINVLEFKGEQAPTAAEISEATQGILAELDAAPWKSIASVTEKNKKGTEIVRVSLFNDGTPEPAGLAVLVVDGDEVVLVNLVGRVRLEQLSRLGAALGQPDMFGGLIPGIAAKKKTGDAAAPKKTE